MSRQLLGSAFAALVLLLPACSDPPDDTPLGREAAAIMARPEQPVDKVKLQHILLAFVGAMRGSESGHTMEEARTLAGEVLARARGGEDFNALMLKYSNDEGPGVYVLTQDDRDGYADAFGDIGFRLNVGEIGIATYNHSTSPFGWHVIKRLQ